MKKLVFAIFLVVFAIGSARGGVYRIYTRQEAPGWRVERLEPPEGPKVAPIVPQNDDGDTINHWDDMMSDGSSNDSIGPYPLPWGKMYERDDAHWISWTTAGKDTVSPLPRPGNPRTWKYYYYYSPVFKMYDNISRATIWCAVDDDILSAWLRNIDTGERFLLPGIRTGGYATLKRFDVTDAFRARSEGNSNPPYQMEFYVRNRATYYTGIIVYMSYDYGDAQEYTYNFPDLSSDRGWKHISMPFYPTDTAATIFSLFPGIDTVVTFDDRVDSVYGGDTTCYIPLRGEWGDRIRTYSVMLHYPIGGSFDTTITGYPVFEQRYLGFDTTASAVLRFGTVNCKIPFSPPDSLPDDYPDGKILASRTYQASSADGESGFVSSPDTIQARYWYNTIPVNFEYSFPYSFDVACEGMFMSLVEEDLGTPVYFGHTEEELKEMRELASFVPDTPDTADIIAYLEGLRERELLPDGDTNPIETGRGFGKNFGGHSTIPSGFVLLTYPNPFNSEVSVVVDVPQDGDLLVEIYDIGGRLVRTLFREYAEPGRYGFVWNGIENNGKFSPSGIYLVRVEFLGQVRHEKIILLK